MAETSPVRWLSLLDLGFLRAYALSASRLVHVACARNGVLRLGGCLRGLRPLRSLEASSPVSPVRYADKRPRSKRCSGDGYAVCARAGYDPGAEPAGELPGERIDT